MNPSSLLTAVVLGLGLIACQMTTPNENRTAGVESRTVGVESDTTGLEGRAMIVAPCPGPAREDQPCPDKPVSASFDVLDAENKVVARFQSDAEGYFKVALQPGVYTIAPDLDAPLFNPRMQRRQVTVQTGKMTEMTLRFDSGMR